MQRPRRTSEFQEDPLGLRRQSRPQQKGTSAPSPAGNNVLLPTGAGGTAKKYNARQSRIAVPLRSSSSERKNSIDPYLGASSSVKQRLVTPQKTPMPKNSISRVLFTAEKTRIGQTGNTNSVPLQNDKKWVQEQTQRITEHLLKQQTLAEGISTDFVRRGLRQMSIKQFVAIINYFLGYIWGTRFTVGNNYVDDIINILQKLKYPHPLNKSWLKTPNTQHSFGNVILLFDFFMDFVPSDDEKNDDEMYFDLKDNGELSDTKMNEDPFQIPDLEFQRELLRNSEKGFSLWDKQKNEEFDYLQLSTGNLLIQKICGVNDLKSLDLEIEKLQEVLKSLKNESPTEDREMLEMKSKLSHELKSLSRDIKKLQEEYEANEITINNLISSKTAIAKEVVNIEMDIKALQEVLNNQSCTVELRDQMMADVMQHKQMLAIKERAIQDLQNRYHNEQILQSRAIKQFNNQIETFNAHMREIKFSNLMTFDDGSSPNEENLELSLRPQQSELNKLVELLEKINKNALHCIQLNKENIFQLQEHCEQIKNNIDISLLPKINVLRTANTANANNLQKLLQEYKQDECKLHEKIQTLEENLFTADKTISELECLNKNKKSLIADLVEANEQTMSHAEQKHRQCIEQKKAFLKAYDELLEECLQSDLLQQLSRQVELQERQLEELRKDFQNEEN